MLTSSPSSTSNHRKRLQIFTLAMVGVSIITNNLVMAQEAESDQQLQANLIDPLDGAASERDLNVAETGAVGGGKAGAILSKGGFKKGAAAGKANSTYNDSLN